VDVVIERLQNNQHILLMYLADELSPEDRREVDQMLATDAGLRAQLQQLEETQQAVYEGLSRLDGASRLSAGEAAAGRRAAAEIRRRLAKPEIAAETTVTEPRRRSLWWVYPTAAAAVVVLAAAVWMPSHGTTRRPITPNTGVPREYSYGYPYALQLYDESWDPTDLGGDPNVRPVSEDLLAMTDGHRDRLPPVDPLNQLLLSADANR
jgi:hypothetical protein